MQEMHRKLAIILEQKQTGAVSDKYISLYYKSTSIMHNLKIASSQCFLIEKILALS